MDSVCDKDVFNGGKMKVLFNILRRASIIRTMKSNPDGQTGSTLDQAQTKRAMSLWTVTKVMSELRRKEAQKLTKEEQKAKDEEQIKQEKLDEQEAKRKLQEYKTILQTQSMTLSQTKLGSNKKKAEPIMMDVQEVIELKNELNDTKSQVQVVITSTGASESDDESQKVKDGAVDVPSSNQTAEERQPVNHPEPVTSPDLLKIAPSPSPSAPSSRRSSVSSIRTTYLSKTKTGKRITSRFRPKTSLISDRLFDDKVYLALLAGNLANERPSVPAPDDPFNIKEDEVQIKVKKTAEEALEFLRNREDFWDQLHLGHTGVSTGKGGTGTKRALESRRWMMK